MTTQTSLTVATDRRLIRAVHHSTRYVVAEIVAPPAPPASANHARPRVNVAFVLDRSGSMGGDKIVLARRAIREGIERLAADDRFAVVSYDTEIDIVAPSQQATQDAKAAAIRALDSIEARHNTNLGEGWLRGAEQVASHLEAEGINRVLLLSDGLANEGITDTAELARHAVELRVRGVSTSTFGVGADYNEQLLGSMADAGGGAFRHIKGAAEIPPMMASEVGELLEVTARAVELRIAGPDGMRIEPLSTFAFDRTMRDGVMFAGDLVADQVLRIVIALTFPLGEIGRETGVEFEVRDRIGALRGDQTLTWAFADGDANDRQPRNREVDRLVARMYADRALREAVELNRRGEWAAARDRLRAVARRVRSYAGDDPVLRGIVDELLRESEAWARPRVEEERKARYAASAYSLRSRSQLGDAERRQR